MRLLLVQPASRSGDGATDIAAAGALLERNGVEPRQGDVLVLPELIGGEAPRAVYLGALRRVAGSLGVYVVGGSHICASAGEPLNRGVVVDPAGAVVGEYEKQNRYGSELTSGVRRGRGGCVFSVDGVTLSALICADFWNLVRPDIDAAPDVVIVPAFSVTQRATPHMAKARWRHQAVAKAYELTAFVGVSDWAPSVVHADGRSSGVAGFARPNPARVRELFAPLGRASAAAFPIDLDELAILRRDRRRRGFMAEPASADGRVSDRR